MTKIEKIKAWAVVIISLMIVFGILWISSIRDVALMEWSIKYEACVLREYRTTPGAWRAVHGEYPPCELKAEDIEPILLK